MTNEEMIELAKQAGWEMDDSLVLEPEIVWYISRGQLEAFAKLVAEKELKKASERVWIALTNKGAVWHLKQMCTDAIEARGQE